MDSLLIDDIINYACERHKLRLLRTRVRLPPAPPLTPKGNTMKLSKRQLKRIIREEKARMLAEQAAKLNTGSIALDHVIKCYLEGMDAQECADTMPNASDSQGLMDLADFVAEVTEMYGSMGSF